MVYQEGTQKARILAELRTGPFCSSWGYHNYIGRLAARIDEMKGDGFDIESVPCDWDHGHAGRHVIYRLNGWSLEVAEATHPQTLFG